MGRITVARTLENTFDASLLSRWLARDIQEEPNLANPATDFAMTNIIMRSQDHEKAHTKRHIRRCA
jgi:hypothetical protein